MLKAKILLRAYPTTQRSHIIGTKETEDKDGAMREAKAQFDDGWRIPDEL
jgi:hypothetical protein